MADIFSNEVRRENMDKVLKAIQNVDLDFNELVFTFADLIQSAFLNGALVGKDREEQQTFQTEVVDLTNKLIEVLNQNSLTSVHDMVVFTNLIMDSVQFAIESGRARQGTV